MAENNNEKNYLDWEGLQEYHSKIINEIEKLQVVNVQSISTNTTSSCSITGSENSGKIEYVIYTNSSNSDVIITIPTTYKTPSGSSVILTCKPSGYCEVSYINANGVIYARGL